MSAKVTFLLMFTAFLQAANLKSNLRDKTLAENNANYGEFPYQVSLRIFNQHVCSGVIIKNKYVLTSAHCVENYKNAPRKIKLVVGGLKLSRPILIFYASKIIVHNKFNRTTGENDIALIKTRSRFIFSGVVNVVRMPNLNHTLNVNQTVIVSGWSRVYFNGYISDHLQRVRLVIGNHKSCRKIYNSELSAKFLFFTYHKKSEMCLNNNNNGPLRVRELQHFCAYDPNFMQGTCQFDSGGALTDNGILVGLISWGDPLHCGGFDYPVVCIKVSNYINWINENVD